ncbi:MAG TPA: hypothetical protein VF418_04700 [Sphingomonadaceae bacterium]
MRFDWASVVFLLMALLLPVSALARRKLDWRKGAVMALAWIGIFGLVALFITAVRG